ncbi:DUF1919 domain-containing protein [Photobacterium kishitanii]|uniref:DUF1919 domain-containing protein n=2 Tax=Photobacterium kishitanii TaxID=318456 RepID=A0A0B7JJ56_9GAMM|nr:DUF1919 domain-containing protein [Photobacterium kishitanii]PSU89544.1 DUF1919 domain-containing protein [Photobacterium kishitanii]PSU93468.1 DUF1919 domain-containing protein [Photobacterium kishitanii]PSV22322.1 DUF1919 domain-containing protein [Photobacterium kishitanii]CEO41427.1 conserved hypothetical protein [Photobacterium kishitanii]
MIQRVISSIYRRTIYKVYRSHVNKKLQARLKNKNFSLISNNCIGGITCSDLAQPFNSPTVGLFFYSDCYLKFCENLEYYLSLELEQATSSKYIDSFPYLLGKLDDIEIHLIHDTSFAEAKEKWDRRRKRVDFDNLFFVMSDRDICNEGDIERFLRLDNGRSVFFGARKRSNLDNYVYCYNEKGDITPQSFARYRVHEQYFDMIEWLNSKRIVIS